MGADERHPNSSDANAVISRRGIGIGALGLGDAIRAVTKILGIKPCAACEKRAAKLNALSLSRLLRRKQR